MNAFMRKVRSLILAALLVAPSASFAFTDCSGHLTKLVVTDGGTAYFYMDTNLQGILVISDPNYRGGLALGIAGMLSGKTVSLRVDASSCPVGFSPIIGVSLYPG